MTSTVSYPANNSSHLDHPFPTLYICSWTIQFTVCIVGVIGNLLVVISHIKDPLRCFRVPSSWFMLNIAVLDIIVSLLMIIRNTISAVTYYLHIKLEATSIILTNVWMMASFMSAPMFFALATERYCSVAFPIWHRTRLTTRICCYYISTLWIVHFIVEVLITAFFSPIDHIELDIISATYIVMFFVIAQFMYIATYISLRKQRIRILRQQSGTTSRTIITRTEFEKHFVRTVALVCFISALTQLPSMIHQIYINLIKPNMQSITVEVMTEVVLVSLSSNFAINPFLYFWRLSKYRKTFQLLCCKQNTA